MRWWQNTLEWLGLHDKIAEQWRNRVWQDVPLLAIDLELTSLDTSVAAITSIGWVSGRSGQIDLSSTFYQVINTQADLQQSPVIHGLTAEHIAMGDALEPALRQLSTMLHSHIWVFHHAPLDMQVLSREMQALGISLDGLLTYDTLSQEKYLLQRAQAAFTRNSVTLADSRRRHQLADAPAHNALDDALATLELAFAQLSQLKVLNHKISDLNHCHSLHQY